VFSGFFLPTCPWAFQPYRYQALTRRFDVAAADGESRTAGGGGVPPGLRILQIGEGLVHGATRADRQSLFARDVQLVEDLGDPAGAVEQAQTPAVEHGLALGLALEKASGTAELLSQGPEVH